MWSGQVEEEERLLRALHASHARPLLAHARRLLGGDRQRSEDIVQETPRRAWQYAEDLDADHGGPWLFTVARLLVIDQRRHRPNRLVDLAPAPIGEMSTSDDLDTALGACLLLDALRPALLERGGQQP